MSFPAIVAASMHYKKEILDKTEQQRQLLKNYRYCNVTVYSLHEGTLAGTISFIYQH